MVLKVLGVLLGSSELENQNLPELSEPSRTFRTFQNLLLEIREQLIVEVPDRDRPLFHERQVKVLRRELVA